MIMSLYDELKDTPYFKYLQIKEQHDLENLSREERLSIFEKQSQERKPFMNKYDNPFMNIPNFEGRLIYIFSKGDSIIVQEKIDGSNTHINVSDNGFECFGNNYILNEVNHLQGFWFWCKNHYKDVPEKYYGLDIYGEWLVPHHCEYPAEKYTDFYVFDVMENGEYWTQDRVEQLAKECNFSYAPVLYSGEFESWKHLMSFVGQTMLGGEKGEGIVVKNQSKLNSKKQFYIKIVDVEFQETNKSREVIKSVDMDLVLKVEEEIMLSKSIVTVPRVRKIIMKLIDTGDLPMELGLLDNKSLVNIIKRHVISDCMKEEKEITDKVGNKFGKYCNDILVEMISQGLFKFDDDNTEND